MRDIRISIQRNPSMRGVELWIYQKSLDGHVAFAKPIEMINLESEGSFTPPTFVMDEDKFQLLIDELWNQGYRPSKYENDGSAQEKHLQDMRRIAFQYIDGLKK